MGKAIISRIIFALFTGLCTTGLIFINPPPILAQYSPQNQQLNDLLRQARELVDAGDYDRAIAAYEQAASYDRRNGKIYAGIGYLRTQQGQYREASRAYQQALAIERNNPDFYYAYAYALAQMGDNRNAARAYERAIQLAPTNTNSYLGLGVVLMRDGHHARALEVYNRAARNNPQDGRIYGLMATALLELNREREAIEMLQRAVERYPRNSQLWVQLGIFLAGINGDSDAALNAFQTAQRRDPNNANASLQMGRILRERGQIAEARTMFYQAASVGANSWVIQLEVGDFFFEQKSYLSATRSYKDATQLAPNNPETFYKLGLALKERRLQEEAINAWNRALELYRRQGDRAGQQKMQSLLNEMRSHDGIVEPFN